MWPDTGAAVSRPSETSFFMFRYPAAGYRGLSVLSCDGNRNVVLTIVNPPPPSPLDQTAMLYIHVRKSVFQKKIAHFIKILQFLLYKTYWLFKKRRIYEW